MTNLNFKISELIHSDEANKRKINNMPDINSLDNMLELIVHCLQPIRDKLKKPIVVTSGYRNVQVNKLVGGSSTSGHLTGRCADIHVNGMTAKELYNFIKKSGVKYRQCILESNSWVHIDYKKDDLKCENLIYDGKSYVLDK